MKKSSTKGFTLIELLAVIVILAIIALITVPLILNVIETSKKGSFKDTAYGLIESAELYYSKQQLKGNNISSKTFTFPNAKDLGYKGETPKSGKLKINSRGQVSLAVSNSKYCITKNFNESEVIITDELENCKMKDYIDKSGANSPDLLNNMVPVTYDGKKWTYADTTDEWYNYEAREWANAVVLNTGVTKEVGDVILESDVALWYVWIPRYKYQLFNANNERVPEQLIDITFESNVDTTGTVKCTTASNGVETCTNAKNGNWYTHPAFTLGNQELTGIWVGKFEVSTSDVNCNSNATAEDCNKELPVTIKPNVSSWRNSNVFHFFNSIQKMSNNYSINNGDSHMIKNIEWGAIAYLKQSKYGLGMAVVEANDIGESHLTGEGAYKDNISQSTTGNIYGIYDMSGGAWEFVMGNMVNSSGKFYSNRAGFSTAPDAKYYDCYAYDAKSPSTYERGHLGDATRETLKTEGGWYGQFAYFTDSEYAWFGRGGYYSVSSNSGVFYFSHSTGNLNTLDTTRAVLTHK